MNTDHIPNPASDTAREAAEHIHDQYRAAIKALFDAEPFRSGENTKRLLAERIQTAIDDSTAALRREVEELRAKLKAIHDITYPYADGAEDASMHDKLCAQISDIAKP